MKPSKAKTGSVMISIEKYLRGTPASHCGRDAEQSVCMAAAHKCTGGDGVEGGRREALVCHILGGLVEIWGQWEIACCWLICWSDRGRSGTCSAAACVRGNRLCDCNVRLVVCWICRWLQDHVRVCKAIVIEPLAVLQGRCRRSRRGERNGAA